MIGVARCVDGRARRAGPSAPVGPAGAAEGDVAFGEWNAMYVTRLP
ncbi:hypothetical protein [Micromonospora sp. NPDC049799]